MSPAVFEWFRGTIARHSLRGRRVVEIGSRNINGSVRPLFEASAYVGVDRIPGPGVDVVSEGGRFLCGSIETFEVVVMAAVLEHTENPVQLCRDAYGHLTRSPTWGRAVGTLLIAVPTLGFPLHEYPDDFWRPTPSCVEKVLLGRFGSRDVSVVKTGGGPVVCAIAAVAQETNNACSGAEPR